MSYKIETQLKTRVLSKMIAPWQELSNWSVDHLPATIDTIVDNLMAGLGFGNVDVFVADLKQNLVGIDWAEVGKDVGLAIKGVGEGISKLGKDLHYALGFVSKFTGDGSIEGLAKLTTEMFGFALAIHAITPVLGTLTAITSAFSALRGILVAANSLGLLLAGGGAAEGAGGVAALGLTGIGLLPITIAAITVGTIAVAVMNWDSITDAWTSTVNSLKDAIRGNAPKLDPSQQKDIQGLQDREKGMSDSFKQGPAAGPEGFVPMSWNGSDYRNLFTKASYSPSDAGEVVKDSLVDSSRTIIEVRDELIQTNELLKQSIVGDVGGDGPHGGDAGSGGAPNMRYGRNASGGRNATPGGSGGGPTVSGGAGGSRSWRNNNPGNIEYGSYAKSMGAIGTDGRFAVFPNYAAGRKAQEHLLFESKGYKDLTLAGAINKWAPGSENNVPAYIAAMGGDPNAKMSSFSPAQRSALLDAMQRHEGWRVGTKQNSIVSPDGNSSFRGGSGNTGAAVDRALSMLGMGAGASGQALGAYMHSGAWCADFVNATLKSAGVKGSGSAMAASFSAWGKHVDLTNAQKGDVIEQQRGGRVGHVGFATGNVQRDRNGAVTALEMVSGNFNGQVTKSWLSAAAIADLRRSGEEITKGVVAATKPAAIAKKVGAPSDDDSDFKKAGGQSADASAPTHHVQNLHFHGMGNHSPEQLASVMGRELENVLAGRSHDVDHYVG